MTVMNKNLISGAGRSLVELVLQDHNFLQARLIEQMDWRASQPCKPLLSKELQWSESSKIGFCGDWFDLNCSGGVELAMNSSIRLAKLIEFH